MMDPRENADPSASADWIGILALWLALLAFGLAGAIAMLWGAWRALVLVLSWLA